MSPADGIPHDARARVPKAVGRTRARRQLAFACSVLLAVAAQTFRPPHQTHAQPAKPQQAPLSLRAAADTVTLCGDGGTRVQLIAKAAPDVRPSGDLKWSVTGGKILGKGFTPVWDLNDAKPGTYTATVSLVPEKLTAVAPPSISASASVTVEACPRPEPCPKVTVECPDEMTDGETLIFRAHIEGGAPKRRYKTSWSLGNGPFKSTRELPADSRSAGTLIVVASRDQVREVTATFNVYGVAPVCSASCTTKLGAPATPTQTPTVTPTASPFSSHSGGQTSSPEASPTASPSPSPPGTPDAQGTRGDGRLLVALSVVAALGAGALLAAKLFSAQLSQFFNDSPGTSAPPEPGSPLTEGALRREGAAAVVFGGLQKEGDVVHCTVFAPPRVAPGDQFIVQVFAHLAKQARQLAGLAARTDAAALDHGSQPLKGTVERGTLLTFTLEMPGLKVDGAHSRGESLVWRGAPESVQFAVDVPEDYVPAKAIRCSVRIYSGEARAPVGHIMFMLDVAAVPAATSATLTPPPQAVKRYTHAFVSYCSKDRSKILPIYLGKRTEWRKAGITDFFDRKDIGAGAGWNEEIQKNLDRCDLFVLFWSTSAMCSQEVGKEIAYALARKGGDDWNPPTFDPLSIELPVPQPLPDGLKSLNFDDALLYFIKADEALREEGGAPRPRPGDGAA